MNFIAAILAGLLSITAVAWAADATDIVDPAGALEDAAKDAAIDKGKESVGVPDDTLDKLEEAKATGAEAKESVADPDAAMEDLKNKGIDAASEKAKDAIPTPTVPKLP